ncbi:hypothetical protein [Roseateles terrae]|uniref:Uncharacterized protein n=1 Tax=Roseateles terrae TaxID=431060 RepID=A0ABR6GYG0_9BURK|nr:hypothetical protein [Roseateles terrae]MBB3196756.1 hypothetical protein [Roseateles terrae]OWQ84991.1 hypothetical protein CDN98_18280 [Roseateles terrae]
MLSRPAWVQVASTATLQFGWDDAVGGVERFAWSTASAQAVSAALRMAPRGRMALALGLFEWIVWRMDGLHDRTEPLTVLEAGWCATADPRYLRFFELSRSAWIGPVEGPLWMGMTWLHHALSGGVDRPRDLYDGIDLLTRLSLHVQPVPAALIGWLAPVLDRLVTECPAVPDDPLADLFGRDPASRMGPWVSRHWLDPMTPVHAQDGYQFLSQLLAQARADANPFLAGWDDLADAGFSGTPDVPR